MAAVRPSIVGPIGIFTVTCQCAACAAASIHFSKSYIFVLVCFVKAMLSGIRYFPTSVDTYVCICLKIAAFEFQVSALLK